ncbi:MAG: ComF family protein [Bdellovibrionales bacterium]|nr:ComF family protein [Bdellovibrionales bacterium]
MHDFFNLLLPKFCLVCERRIPAGLLCLHCLPEQKQLTIDKSFDFESFYNNDNKNKTRIIYLWEYQGNIKDIIKIMKYKPSLKLTNFLATKAASILNKENLDLSWDFIAPIPSSMASKKQRLFNQSQVIAKEISKSLQIPINCNCISHCKSSGKQVKLNAAKRKRNMKNVFKASPKLAKDKSILIVDDVLTTGATFASAANALYNAKARNVDLFCLARSTKF